MKILEYCLDLLYPPKCVFCHKIIKKQGVCEECSKQLPYTRENSKQRLPEIACCVSPLYYEGMVRESVLRYKFGGVKSYSASYAEFIAKCIDLEGISCDIITWVPLSRKRRRKRGYDQAGLIAKELSRMIGVPCESLLRKCKNNPAQSRIHSPAQRRINVAGVYQAVASEKMHGSRILLVDDVVTTGSTLSECACVLKSGGAAEIIAATLARSKKE